MSAPDVTSTTVKVWDPLVRVFHWSLVLLFFLAFITEDDWLDLHLLAGYAVSFLVGFRLLWGLVGTRNARFMTFVKPPKVMFAYAKDLLGFKVRHYLGHNPLGAAMVVTLMLSITLASLSGMILIAAEGHGPLASTFMASWNADWMKEAHEFFANFTLLMVAIHVSGVILSSRLESENLVKAMFTGRKKFRSHWEDVMPASTQEHKS